MTKQMFNNKNKEQIKQEVREKLFELSDQKYKKFYGGLCPGVSNIMGVRVPVLRKLAKEIAKEDYQVYLGIEDDDMYYEEIMLQGMMIGLIEADIQSIIEQIKTFVPKINNWAICDVFCAGLKVAKKNKKAMWDIISKYLKSEQEFEKRFAIVMMLDFYIDEEHIHKVLEQLDKTKHQGYYVKMAVAWAISICYIKFPDITEEYLLNNTLDDFTYNKALQKILESYRVDKERKNRIRGMKRK